MIKTFHSQFKSNGGEPMIDARELAVTERVKSIELVIPVVSGKGGVGKSTVAAMLAMALAERRRVGLLDLDFWGASLHTLLGVEISEFPSEDKGIIPIEFHGIKFMSAAFYTRNRPLPIRGSEYTDAFLELMAVTRWDDIDILVIDMPPSLGDPFLNAVKYLPHGKFVVVTTPSKLSINVARNTLLLLKEQGFRIIALVENMVVDPDESEAEKLVSEFEVPYLVKLPYSKELESAIGQVERLKQTKLFEKVKGLAAIF